MGKWRGVRGGRVVLGRLQGEDLGGGRGEIRGGRGQLLEKVLGEGQSLVDLFPLEDASCVSAGDLHFS